MDITIILLGLAFLISCLIVANMLPKILVLSLKKRLIDRIDSRKVHNVAASRLGGVSFFPAIMLSLWFTIVFGFELEPHNLQIGFDRTLLLECSAVLMLYLIGVYDDIIEVPYKRKFAMQILSAMCIVYSGTYFTTLNGLFGIYEISHYVGIPLTLILLVFISNAINLIDGIDGLASSLSMVALATFGIIFYINEELMNSVLAFATFGALVPFCYNNVFGIRRRGTSKIFMGDAGALVIGIILGFMVVQIWEMGSVNRVSHNDQFAAILAFTVMIIPCFDVVRIIIHRFRDHKPIFLPDRNHIHHKFLALGFSARRSLLLILCLNVIFIALNLILSRLYVNLTIIVVVDAVLWTSFHYAISRVIVRRYGDAWHG